MFEPPRAHLYQEERIDSTIKLNQTEPEARLVRGLLKPAKLAHRAWPD
jgi:hypothetical protein